ncbi:MAG: hypothetical protein AAFY11_01130 [Cyanobacteria bacterium J06641_5]
MTRGKIVAILTGAIAVAIAVAYLLLVALLDARGPMVPAPPVGFFLGWF